MQKQYFDVPIALFMFKRSETVVRIIDVIRRVKPLKVYLIGDGPRNDEERIIIEDARKTIEEAIDWDCEIVKDYAEVNRGVYENIAGGAKRVLEREGRAIFLEDDNLPEETFFEFCKQMLEKYENDERVLWICGTNYLEKYQNEKKESYVFTKHLMPCGWASWYDKFLKYYDGDLEIFSDKKNIAELRKNYTNQALRRQQLNSAGLEIYRRNQGFRYASWDFQMAISIRANDVYGICPCCNQIKNIGVDSLSTHGGTSLANEMTRRFCGIESYPMKFPLVHPETIKADTEFEIKVDKIILFPFKMRAKIRIATIVKTIFGISKYEQFTLENISKRWKEDNDYR